MVTVSIYKDNLEIIKDGKNIDFNKNFNNQEKIDKFIEKFESQNVNNNKIIDLYKYKDIEIYNFARGSICNKINELLNKFLLIEGIVNKFSEDEINITSDDEILIYISNCIFNLNGKYIKEEVTLIDDKKNNVKFKKIFKAKRIIKSIEYIFKILLGKKSKDRLLAISQASDINGIKINDKYINYESQYGDLLTNTNKEIDIINLQYLNSDKYLESSFNLKKKFLAFEVFLILKKTLFKLKIDDRYLKNKLGLLESFDLTFNNKDLYELLNKFLFVNIEDLFISYLREIHAAEKFIKLLKINKVICTDEADRARCFIYAANKLGLETFAIQHGIITKASVSYFIPSKDENYVPKKTFLWGETFKEILIENTNIYKEDNIFVVGQVRTDYLFKKINSEKRILDKSNKLKVLYATQYVEDLSNEATELLFSALNDFKEPYELLIKTHPAEYSSEKYSNYIKKYNLKDVRIVNDMDIYDAIIWSDIVVSVHSTINLEALLLNKPSMCLLLNKYWDKGNFVKDGVSFGAKNKEEINYIFKNLKIIDKNEYLKKNFYKIDGNVTNRILKNII